MGLRRATCMPLAAPLLCRRWWHELTDDSPVTTSYDDFSSAWNYVPHFAENPISPLAPVSRPKLGLHVDILFSSGTAIIEQYPCCFYYKKLSYRRGTSGRAMSVEILSPASQLCEECHLKILRPTVGEWPWESFKVVGCEMTCCHFDRTPACDRRTDGRADV